jgi:hypothetical protein
MNKRQAIRSVGVVFVGVVLGVLFMAGVLLLVGVISFYVFDANAEGGANALCGATAIGSSADAALERAKEADSAMSEPGWVEAKVGEQDLIVMFPDNDPMSGYTCEISARDGRVTLAAVSSYIID